jgi:hypothetical protein
MGTRICPGGCLHLEVDAKSSMTTATFQFLTPTDPMDFGSLMTRLAAGIEVLIEVDDEDDD